MLTYSSSAKAFGRAAGQFGRLDEGALMRRRLHGKIENFEREAARLALRGEEDAAHVLERAAWRLKVILKREPESAVA